MFNIFNNIDCNLNLYDLNHIFKDDNELFFETLDINIQQIKYSESINDYNIYTEVNKIINIDFNTFNKFTNFNILINEVKSNSTLQKIPNYIMYYAIFKSYIKRLLYLMTKHFVENVKKVASFKTNQ